MLEGRKERDRNINVEKIITWIEIRKCESAKGCVVQVSTIICCYLLVFAQTDTYCTHVLMWPHFVHEYESKREKMVVFTLTDKLIGYLLGESDHRTVQSCRISGSNCTFCPSNSPKSIHSEMMGNRGTAKKLKTRDGCGVLLCDNDKNDQQTDMSGEWVGPHRLCAYVYPAWQTHTMHPCNSALFKHLGRRNQF